MIGSAEIHTSLTSSEEDDFYGKFPMDSVIKHKIHDFDFTMGWGMSTQGVAAVWASDNTRDKVYSTFNCKKVCSTMWPRTSLSLFAEWSFPESAVDTEDIANISYQSSVSMGGDFTRNQTGVSLQLLIRAVKNPVSTNFDRI